MCASQACHVLHMCASRGVAARPLHNPTAAALCLALALLVAGMLRATRSTACAASALPAPVHDPARGARAQVLTVVFGQDLADESAGAAQQVFSVGVAVGGLAAFALVLALIEQVVLQARAAAAPALQLLGAHAATPPCVSACVCLVVRQCIEPVRADMKRACSMPQQSAATALQSGAGEP